eukprot:2426254-Pyramimonas_sp.AAC.1
MGAWDTIRTIIQSTERDTSLISVLKVDSHFSPAQIIQQNVPRFLVVGNTVADELAGVAAQRCRLDSTHRARVARVERDALLVRRRLLRVALEAFSSDSQAQQPRHRGER